LLQKVMRELACCNQVGKVL